MSDEITKPKKPRTPAQVAAFKKAQEVRHERLRSLNRPVSPGHNEASLKEAKEEMKEPAVAPFRARRRAPIKPQIVYEESDSSSEDEEPQQIIIRRRKSHKPKKAPKVVYESDESESEEEVDLPVVKTRRERKAKAPAPQQPPPPQQQSWGLKFM